jgi:uncharacterized protein involved in exopolysaccharide biosynthesis
MTEELSLSRQYGPASTPTLRDVLAVMFRQRRTLLITFALILGAAVLYGSMSPSYQAEMKVLVRKGRVDPVMTPAPTPSPEFARGEVTEEELNSEVNLLHDQEVLRTVVQAAGLSQQPHFWESNRPEVREERAVRRLGSRLKVDPIRKTNLILVTYASSNPATSAKVLESLAGAYLERHLRLRRPTGELTFFDQQMVESKKSLELTEIRLADFMRTHGVASASAQRDLALQKLSDAEYGRLQTEVAIADNWERVRALEKKLASIPERRTSQVRSADNPLLLEKMKSKLLELELKRTELLTRFKPSYKLVIEIEQQIAETKAAITAERLAPVQEEVTEQDPSHDWAQAELVKAQVELQALQGRENATDDLLGASRASAQRLAAESLQQEELLRNLRAAEEKYLLYAGKREESRIGDALDEKGILNVAIAERPSTPALPLRSVWSFAFLGLVCASTISTGLAFAVDFLDPAFRTADEVISYLGSPVLASLPRHYMVRGRLS